MNENDCPELPEDALPVLRDGEAPRHDLRRHDLRHAITNMLAVVRSIASRTSQTSDTVEEFSMNLDGRLEAYGRALAMLNETDEGVDLEYILAEEFLAVQAHEGEQVRLSGPAIRLRPRAAQTFWLAVHELAVNAIRHGALSNPGGSIDVSWLIDRRAHGGDTLVLDWVEVGGRKLMPLPKRRGFGLRLLEDSLPFELGASTQLVFSGGGLRCQISLPLNDDIAVRSAPLT